MLLHKHSTSEQKRTLTHSLSLKHVEELNSAQVHVEKLLNNSIAKLQEEKDDKNEFIRWELRACWIQHLQDKKNADKDKKNTGDKDKKQTSDKSKSETKVEGLGKPLKILKNLKKKLDDEENPSLHDIETSDKIDVNSGANKENENKCLLKDLLSDSAFTKLKESETGLHLKALIEVAEEKQKAEASLTGDDGIISLEDFEKDPVAEVFGDDKRRSYCRAISSTSNVKQVKLTQAAKAIVNYKESANEKWRMEI